MIKQSNHFAIKNFITTTFLLITILVTNANFSYGSKKDFSDLETNIQSNYEILNARPKILQKNGRPKASVGTILYTFNSQSEPFLLIAQENHNKKGASSYCELGGNAELDTDGQGETFLSACLREGNEESGGAYKIDTKYALLNSYTYNNITSTGREEVYIFLKAPSYISSQALLAATEKQTEGQYKEKIKFKWVKLSDLASCKHEKCEVQDIDGEKETVVLRDYFFKTLNSSKVRDILKAIKAQKNT